MSYPAIPHRRRPSHILSRTRSTRQASMRMQEDPTDLDGISSQKREKKNLPAGQPHLSEDYATNLKIEIRCLDHRTCRLGWVISRPRTPRDESKIKPAIPNTLPGYPGIQVAVEDRFSGRGKLLLKLSSARATRVSMANKASAVPSAVHLVFPTFWKRTAMQRFEIPLEHGGVRGEYSRLMCNQHELIIVE